MLESAAGRWNLLDAAAAIADCGEKANILHRLGSDHHHVVSPSSRFPSNTTPILPLFSNTDDLLFCPTSSTFDYVVHTKAMISSSNSFDGPASARSRKERNGKSKTTELFANAALAIDVVISLAPLVPIPILSPILSSAKKIVDAAQVSRISCLCMSLENGQFLRRCNAARKSPLKSPCIRLNSQGASSTR